MCASVSHLSPPSEFLSAGVIAVAAGYFHTCGLLMGGRVYCLGYNYYGQLGTGDTDDQSSPATVNLESGDWTALSSCGCVRWLVCAWEVRRGVCCESRALSQGLATG